MQFVFVEVNFEIKLPIIWADEKAEVERIREEKTRSEKDQRKS